MLTGIKLEELLVRDVRDPFVPDGAEDRVEFRGSWLVGQHALGAELYSTHRVAVEAVGRKISSRGFTVQLIEPPESDERAFLENEGGIDLAIVLADVIGKRGLTECRLIDGHFVNPAIE